jgi:DNA repair exonuclease SbcCD ATPase subunit
MALRRTSSKPYFEVELGLEQGMSLLWRYNRTGSKKTRVELRDAQGEIVETSNNGTGPSEWLHTYLAMAPVNGENIHFHSQKRPHYLLDSQEYTSIERAQMLPLGRESRDVMKMIQEFNTRASAARQNRTRLERDLNIQRNLLAAMSLIIENPVDPIALHDRCDELLTHHAEVEALGKKIEQLAGTQTAVELYQTALEALERQVILPVELMVTEPLERCITIITRAGRQSDVLSKLEGLKALPKPPEIRDLSEIIKLGSRIKNLEQARTALGALTDIEPLPALEVVDRSTMKQSLEGLMDLEARLQQLLKDVEKSVEASRLANEAKLEFIKSMGGECPTCFQPMQEGANEHAHG